MRAALDAADAGRLVRLALARPDVSAMMRAAAAVDVLAVGKAAQPMLDAFTREALASVRYARVVGGAHPIPDERSVAAAHTALAMAAGVSERDLLIVLLSGGASSLMALPAEGITLEDKQRTAQRLLSHGAEIHHLAAVRKHLSGVKGGQLAAATPGAVLTLAVSDVVGDDLSAIGGGPTVPDETTFEAALGVLEEYGGVRNYPAAVVTRLEHGAGGHIPETPKPGAPALARSQARVIGGRHAALDGARAVAEALGYAVHVTEEPIVGEARVAGAALISRAVKACAAYEDKARAANSADAARTHSDAARTLAVRGLCILAAGETTVRVKGTGKGGRNQECALAMADALDAFGMPAVAASVGTDGIDGPTDAAGAIVDNTTLARAKAIGLDARTYLNDNNTYAYFSQLDDLLKTGPTHTNVGDVQVILIG